MSKLAEFKRLKSNADRLAKLAELASGAHRCDKFRAAVTLTDTSLGFYGDSSCRSWGEEETEAVRLAIMDHWFFLITAAARKAAAEAEQARKAAEDEAREVLELTAVGTPR